ncbi:acyl-CoA dehydrogenase family protein [Actinomadura parmotrematis]|uniref:Acyl-CoA/acyl-ACP dehydrogenase n=1 Tax=Actinomadura parmotrematis TaxID=2864039 RepID=A0ABS7FPM4_9ACTN|nr:acyl-CoA dehydrogenase family protein [Actinomadura parmotrematis]MBW8482170.1 acyl-CoA/acyl-ACP dehydrogenase [Actinomadura parmotrematis]
MRLLQSDDQRDLASAVRAFLAETSPIGRVREIAESDAGHDPRVWERMAGELGLAGLAIPEEHGGSGAGRGELAAVLEELGAALTPSPLLGAVIAADLLLASGDSAAAKDLLPGIAAGTTLAVGVLPVPGDPEITASGGTLTGVAPRVPHGLDADLIIVPAGGELYAVRGADAARTALTTLDLTRPQARVEFAATPARHVGTADVDRALDLASVALAAEQLGGLRRCLDAIVEYAKLRVQFGRYVGSFQGVKHRLADMHCVLEQAEAVVRYATWAADEDPGELPVAAALAQSYLGRAYFRVARDHLLLHGGIGFTWEHDAHLYYKRAKTDELLLGAPRRHRERLAAHLDLLP